VSSLWSTAEWICECFMTRWHRDSKLELYIFFYTKLPPKCQTGRKRNRPPLTHVSTVFEIQIQIWNKELVIISQVSLILRSPWLHMTDGCVRACACSTRACALGFTHIFCVFLRISPPLRPSYARYSLSVPLFFYDYTVHAALASVRDPHVCELINCNLYFDRRPMTMYGKQF
jgi:hypothetical protein